MGDYADDAVKKEMKDRWGIDEEWPTMATAKTDAAALAVTTLNGLPYVSHRSSNNNVHIIIESFPLGKRRVDFWPTTGLWKIPGRLEKRFGLPSLLDYLATWEIK